MNGAGMAGLLVFGIFGFVILAVFSGMLLAPMRRKRRRQLAAGQPFPDAWKEILNETMPIYGQLRGALKDGLHRQMQMFLVDKRFEGAGGLEMNDEIRVTIAAQACMLLMNRDADCYPGLHSVVVYPSTFVAGDRGLFDMNDEEERVLLGESWGHGTVVLAWDSVRHGARNVTDGQNVAIHEFAHQLDQETGDTDGAPELASRSAYASWARVFLEEYHDLLEDVEEGRRTVLDEYGATNHAEFFAVATETFFERSDTMKRKHPALYQELSSYYRVDPADW